MNTQVVGMYYAQVCACGAVLKSIRVNGNNAREIGKFLENAARCGRDVEHVEEWYIPLHSECECVDVEEAS